MGEEIKNGRKHDWHNIQQRVTAAIRKTERRNMTQHNFSCPVNTCRKSSWGVWETVSYSWTHAASVHVHHLDRVSHGWPGNTLNTLQGNGGLFSLANMLLQQEDHHLPGGAELHSLSDLDGPEGKTNDHNLSCAYKTQRIWQEHWKRLKLLQFSKICIYKFPLWRICGLGIWSVLTAQAAETLVWLISQCKLGVQFLYSRDAF